MKNMKTTILFTTVIAVMLMGSIALAGCTQTPPSPQALKVSQCLKDKQATIYWANWCPHCKDMKADLGSSFFEVKNLDCAANQANAAECEKAGVTGYPLIKLGDGGEISGYPQYSTAEERLSWLEGKAC